jgi:type I restriction-modification system DNA methylase subunit
MANEAKTEELFRCILDGLGYYSSDTIVVERQQSDVPRIQKLLRSASKSEKGNGAGFPDFIIRDSSYPQLLIVVECKASVTDHESQSKKEYSKYAVDGSLLYASFLSKEYDIIAIGVSGENKQELRVSNYLHLKDTDTAHSSFGSEILSFEDYYEDYIKSDFKYNQDYESLLSYSKELNDLLHSKKIPESNRSLLISAILIALENEAFSISYKLLTSAKQITKQILDSVREVLDSSDIPVAKIKNILHAYSFIEINSTLTSEKEFMLDLISEIDENINSFIRTHGYFDAIGQFYIEFLRYANSDKGLGIVLTPPHITQLFVELAEVDKDSVVLDSCCGTSGFLISAMRRMIDDAKANSKKINDIKSNQLIGIEFQDHIYALATSNMILHGDGKSNIIQGNCFEVNEVIKDQFNPTVALLNPPYRNSKKDPYELDFALNALDMLGKGGKCIIILPMSCALAQNGPELELKRKLLEKHTLSAVLSMPDDLFHNSKVNVSTCVMIFTAHKSHSSYMKTWFGYWKDDGFIKVKNKGRIDLGGKWGDIKLEWLSAFHNKDDLPGYSIKHTVNHEDEWCSEAYMLTDYSTLTEHGWIKTIRKFIAYQFTNSIIDEVDMNPMLQSPLEIEDVKWGEFKASSLFKLSRGVSSGSVTTNERKQNSDDVLYLRPSNNYSIYNGFISRSEVKDDCIFPKFTLVMGNTGAGSHTFTYLIAEEFVPNNNLTVLVPIENLSVYQKIFLINIIEHNRFRYAYGRIPSNKRFLGSKLSLPVNVNGQPDWDFIEKYIKALPYSKSLSKITQNS